MTIARPLPGDYAPFYQPYLDDTQPADDALQALLRQDDMLAFMATWSEEKVGHRYAEDKWTAGQVLGHMADTERVFAYRLLRIARADKTPLAGFDENAWQLHSRFEARSMKSLVAEMTAVREASMSLIESLDAASLDRLPTSGDNRGTGRALVSLIAGHFAHHGGILLDLYGL